MQGQVQSQKSFAGFLPDRDLTTSYGQMTVCRCPNCDRAATGDLGFCAEDHAAYLRAREAYATLAEAAQVVHANAFTVVPPSRRQMLAEYLVAVASEGLAGLPADIPRSAGLLAAALVAHGRVEPRLLDTRRRSRRPRGLCVAVGGRA